VSRNRNTLATYEMVK